MESINPKTAALLVGAVIVGSICKDLIMAGVSSLSSAVSNAVEKHKAAKA
jgi:hypothetical protein